MLRADRKTINEDEACANCGTDLEWWLKQSKRNKVYLYPSDEAVCSKKCIGYIGCDLYNGSHCQFF